MSKRIESKKIAVFDLEPDGFSIHTFELSKVLSGEQYCKIKDRLYHIQKQDRDMQWIYQEEKGRHCCIRFRENGVRITLEHIETEGQINSYYLRMIVNPRRLIEPGCSYLGILPPEKSSVKKVEKAFWELFEGTVFDNEINHYYLSRIDLCTNIRCDNRRLFRELVRVLRKMPTPPKYERRFFKSKDKKKANQYNKHYLRFCCGTHELIIYDKTYQIQDGNLIVGYEGLPEGVLRFEVHCGREYLRKAAKKSGKKKTADLLWQMTKNSKEKTIDHFSRCFADVRFMKSEKLQKKIKKSTFKKEKKAAMLKLVFHLQRLQSVDKALQKMEKEGYDTAGLLDGFAKLGISPIPLREKFCAQSLPGPAELLRSVAKGKVKVEYVKAKYR